MLRQPEIQQQRNRNWSLASSTHPVSGAGPSHTEEMLTRMPGDGRYAHIEREQRWLLAELPVDRREPVDILDRYLTGTRLRLRRMQSGQKIVWKLCQKVRAHDDSPEVVKLTNIYLSEEEYSVFHDLHAMVLSKTRWHFGSGGHALSADAFHGVLEGLILAECELGDREERHRSPSSAVADVTSDDRFSGGALAALSSDEANALIAEVQQMRVDAPPGDR
jgi:CYTH domain-containing protein